MNDLTLYSVVDTLPALMDSYDLTEEGSPERAECEAEIRRYMEALPRKVDGVSRMLAHLESQAELAAKEIARLQRRKARFERAQERLEGYVMDVLRTLPEPKRGSRRLEGDTSTLSLAKCPPSLNITDMDAIPADFVIVVPASTTVDKAAVKQALVDGREVPGAGLVTDRQRLRRA